MKASSYLCILTVASALTSVLAGENETWDAEFKAAESTLQDGRYAAAADAFRKSAGDAQAFGVKDERYIRSLCKLAEALIAMDDCEGAEENARKALDLSEKNLGPESPTTALALNQLGDALFSREKETEAEPLYQRAYRICSKVLGAENPDTAQCMNNLGVVATRQKRYREAENLLRKAQTAFEKAGDPAKAAIALNNLASAHSDQGKTAQAEEEYRRVLEIREKVLRADHPDIGAACSNLGAGCFEAGKTDEAERLMKRALQIMQTSSGPESSGTAYACNNLGVLYYSQGRLAEAESSYKQAQAIWEKTLPDGQCLATLLDLYADLLTDQGRTGEADDLKARARAIRDRPATSPAEEWMAEMRAGDEAFNTARYADAVKAYDRAMEKATVFGKGDERAIRTRVQLVLALRNLPDYPRAESEARSLLAASESALGLNALETADAANALALVLDDTGRRGEAEPLYQRVVAIRVRALGREHMDVAISLNNLGYLYVQERKYEEAEKLLRQSLEVAEKLHDESYTAFVLNNLGFALEGLKQPKQAEEAYRRALGIYEKLPGPPPNLANVCFNLGNVLRDSNRTDETIKLLQRAIEVLEKQPDEQPILAKALHNLAVIYMGQGGKVDEAEALFLRSRTLWEKTLGPDAPEVAQSLENNARLLEANGRKDEAATMRQRAEEIHAKGH